LLFLCPNILWAADVSLGVSPVWWQYEELSAKRVGGFAGSTPFHSVARGYASKVQMNLNIDLMKGWKLNNRSSAWLPIHQKQSNEQWNFPTKVQKNQLNVTQYDTAISLNRRWGDVEGGILLAYQWHQQARRKFTVNGAAVALANEPIHETVQSTWAGVQLKSFSDVGNFMVGIEAAVPLSMYVANDVVQGVFHKRTGYRLGLESKLSLPWHIFAAASELTAYYHYRKLGGEVLNQTWLWPKNKWQSASLGMALAW